jgi:hypothetical protein
LQQFRQPAIFVGFYADAELRTEFTAVQNNALTERLADGVVGGKCPVYVLVTRKRFCQRLCLCAGLCDTKSNMRAWC